MSGGRRVRFKLSRKQLAEMRTIYAMLIAVRHYNIELKDVPELNPAWLRIHDVMKNFDQRDYSILTDMNGNEYVDCGFFRVRRTESKTGWVVEGNFQWRIKGILSATSLPKSFK